MIGMKRRRGAPCGNQNAFKHGRFARERFALLAEIRAHIKIAKTLVKGVDDYFPSEEEITVK